MRGEPRHTKSENVPSAPEFPKIAQFRLLSPFPPFPPFPVPVSDPVSPRLVSALTAPHKREPGLKPALQSIESLGTNANLHVVFPYAPHRKS